MGCKNCQHKIECFVQRILCEYGLIFRTVLSYPIHPCEFSVFRKSDCENSCWLLTKANFEKICRYALEPDSKKAAYKMVNYCEESIVPENFISGTKSSSKLVFLCNNRADLESNCKCTGNLSSVDVDADYNRQLCISRFLLTAIIYLGNCDELDNIFALMGLDKKTSDYFKEFQKKLINKNFHCIGNNIGPIADSMTDIFRILCDYCNRTDIEINASNLQQIIEDHLKNCIEAEKAWAS